MAGLPDKTESQVPVTQGNDLRHQALQQWQALFTDDSNHVAEKAIAEPHWQAVQRLGLPTPRHEDWKYTPLDSFLAQRFLQKNDTRLTPEQCNALALPLDAWRLVFVDGVFQSSLSDSDCGPFQIYENACDAGVNVPAPIRPEIFLHLTESLSSTRTLVQLPKNISAKKPLYLLHISSGIEGGLNTVHQRHHVEIGKGSQAHVIEHYVSLENAQHFTGSRMSFNVGENSVLQHTKLAFESSASFHFAHNDLHVARAAQVQSQSFLLGAGLCRHTTSAKLDGEGANLAVNSLIIPVKREVCDTRSYLEHNVGHCESRQLHKTIVRDEAKAVFSGLIKVAPNALKTDGQMTNNNLLLGSKAEVDTKPQLEIYADDVKCGHGATVGRVDEAQMFYLRSRGIKMQDALRMIIHAFAAELTEAIEDTNLRQAVLQRIEQRLPDALELS